MGKKQLFTTGVVDLTQTGGTTVQKNINPDLHYGESKFDKNIPFDAIENTNEIRAQRQGNLDKWSNGITKAAGIAGTSILENTAGLVYGLGDAIISQDVSKTYNNAFTGVLDEFNDYVAKSMPNYHTKAEEDYSFLQKLGTSNFWSEQALSGAAYMGAAIATGAGLNKLTSLGKLARAGKAIDETVLATKGWSELDKAAKLIRIADATDFGKNAVLMSHGESAIEARDIYKSTKEQLTKDFVNKYGEDKLNTEAQSVIETNAKAASNWGYATNLAITGTTNALLFPKILSEGYSINKLKLNNIELLNGKYIAESENLTKGISKELLKGSLEEGGQELSQLLTQKTLTDYYSRGFKDKKDQHAFVTSLIKGFEETLGTQEGLENFFLGALMGGPAGAIQARGDIKNTNQQTSNVAELLNNPEIKKTIKNFDNYVRATSYEKDKNEALSKGSKFDYLNAEFNQNKAIAKQFIDNNAVDILIEQYKDMLHMDEAEFKKIAGYDESKPLPKSQHEIINNAIQLVENLNKTNTAINELFPYNPEVHETPEKYNALTTNLWHYSTSIDNMNKRVSEIKNEVFKIASDKSIELTGDGINEQFAVKGNPLVAQQINKLNEDLQVANAYKEALIKSYNLLSNPKTQKSTLNNINDTVEKESDKPEVVTEQPVDTEEKPVEDINDVDFQEFVNTGNIKKEYLESITDKVQSNLPLTEKEQSVYQSKAADIEKILKERIAKSGSTITEDKDIQDSVLEDTKALPNTVNKTAGRMFEDEADTKLNESPEQVRWFNYLQTPVNPENKLLVVTPKNNPTLFDTLVSSDDYKIGGTKHITDSIYVVMVDGNNSIVKVDGQPIYTTLERAITEDTNLLHTRISAAHRLKVDITLNTIEEAKAVLEQEAKELAKLRKELTSTDEVVYLSGLKQEFGPRQIEESKGADRVRGKVVGRITNNINNLTLKAGTAKDGKYATVFGTKVYAGKLYVKDSETGRVYDLQSRKLNPDEIQLAYTLIEGIVNGKKLGLKDKPKQILDNLIYVRADNPNSALRIGVKNGELIIGDIIYNTVDTTNEAEIKEFLSNKYLQYNAQLDTDHTGYIEYKIDSEGNIFTKEWKNYKEYLLDNEDVPFSTDIAKIENDKPRFINPYLTFEPTIVKGSIPISDLVESFEGKTFDEVSEEDLITRLSQFESGGNEESFEKEIEDKPTDVSFDDLTLNRLALNKIGNKIPQSEKDWFKKATGLDYEEIQGLIQGKALGQVTEAGKVLLSSEATEGTLLHEAFHTVTQFILTDKQVDALYKEARSKRGNKDLTDLEVEELLAEDFVNYAKTGKVLGERPKRNTIFRQLLNFLKKLVGLNTETIEEVYSRLYKGGYKNAARKGTKRLLSSTPLSRTKALKGDYVYDKEVMDGITAMFTEHLIKNNFTPNDLVKYSNLQSKLEQLVKNDLIKLKNEGNTEAGFIYDNWNNLIAPRFNEKINSFNLKYSTKSKVKDSEILDSDLVSVNKEEESSTNEAKRSGEAFTEANQTSTKDVMNGTTKWLIASLPQIKDGKIETNSLGLPKLVDFNKTYGQLLNELTGLNTFEEIYSKIQSLAASKPNYVELLKRIKHPTENTTLEQSLLQRQFRQDFSKNRAESFITKIESDGSIYTMSANKSGLEEKIKTKWQYNMRGASSYVTEVGDKLVVDKEVTKIDNPFTFLKALGIEFSPATLKHINKDADTKEEILDLIPYIKQEITSSTDGSIDLYSKESKVLGRINTLASIEGDFTDETIEHSFLSVEGKTIYEISLNNFLTLSKNIINNVKTRQELFDKLPHLNTIYNQNSIWLKTMFNEKGDRRIVKGIPITLNVDLLNGLKSGDEGLPTAKLSAGDKIVQDINNTLLAGKTAYLRAADAASEHSISLSHFVSSTTGKRTLPVTIESVEKGFNNTTIQKIFSGYILDEVNAIRAFNTQGLGKDLDVYNKKGSQFRVFEGILNKSKNGLEALLGEEVGTEIPTDLLQLVHEDVIDFLNQYATETQAFIELNKATKFATSLTEKFNNEQLIRAFVVNDFINSIEQVKLFTGDLAFYKDFYKRTKGLTGCLGYGTKIIMFDGTIKEVQDIIEGDLLMGPDGTPRTVQYLIRGTEQMYLVKQKKGKDYRVNESHIISLKERPYKASYTNNEGVKSIYTYQSEEKIVNLPLNELLEKGIKFFKTNKGWKTSEVFNFNRKVQEPTIEPYYFGLWLGDGVQKNPNIIVNSDIEVIDYLKEYANRLGNGLQLTTCRIQHRITCGLRSNRKAKNNVLLNECTRLKLQDKKYIREEYLFGSEETRLQVLAGLIDSDGTYRKNDNSFRIKQIREQLHYEICLLARSLGFCVTEGVAEQYINKDGGINQKQYIICITGDNLEKIPTRIPRKKANNLHKTARNKYVTDISFSKDIVDNYYGFELDGDHLFLLEDFTVTHNTKKYAENSTSLNTTINRLFKRQDGKPADGFINVAVYNDSKQSSNYIEEYTKAFVDKGFTEEEAKSILSPYTSMDEGDAQGWITLDEWREFMFRTGDIKPKQLAVIDKLIKGEELTKSDVYVIQVLKAQFFGPQVKEGLFAPAYHKFSLMPLIPSMIKGTNLEKLNETLKNNKVGYALFKSGSKVGTLGKEVVIDGKKEFKTNNFYTNEIHGEIETNISFMQRVPYDFLGIQVDISPEMKDKVIYGTQYRKLILSNLFDNGIANSPKFETLVKEYNEIITKYTNNLTEKLKNKLGIKGDNYTDKDITTLVKTLQQAAEERNLPDNLIDALQVQIKEGKEMLKYPIDALVTKPKVEAMLMSLINSNIIRQKVSGDAMIQGASSGFEKLGSRVQGSNELKFYTPGQPMEIKVPFSSHYASLLVKYGTIENVNKAIADGTIDKRLIEVVGYRIPTQGLNSIEYMTIKEFLPTEAGNLIVLPTEIVAKSGGDYDIDKLNVIRPSINKETGEYIEPSETELMNRLLEISKEIVSNESNFVNLVTPNSVDNLKRLVQEIRTLRGQPKEPVVKNQTELLKFKYKIEQFFAFLAGKAGVGIAAVQNTNHIIYQLSGAKVSKSYIDQLNIEIKDIDKEGNASLGNITNINGTKISDLVSEFINAYVDIAKDPFVFDLNATTEAAGVWFYLTRLGADFNTIAYLMNQPIITEYLKAKSINSSLIVKGTKDYKQAAQLKEEVNRKYAAKTSPRTKEELVKYGTKDNETLKEYITGKVNDKEFNQAQLQILDDYLTYSEQARLMSDVASALNSDTAGVGKNLDSSENKLNLYTKVNADGFISNWKEVFDKTFIGAFDKHQFSKDVYQDLFFSNRPDINMYVRDVIHSVPTFKAADADKVTSLVRNDFISYLLQNYAEDNGKLLIEYRDILFKGENSLAKRLINLRKKENKTEQDLLILNNKFVQELFPILNQGNEKTDNLKMFTKKLDTFTYNLFTEEFRQLKDIAPNTYDSLVRLGVLQSGLNNSPITFLGLIPYESYGDLVNNAIDNFDKKNGVGKLHNFKQLFYRNNHKGVLTGFGGKNNNYARFDKKTNTWSLVIKGLEDLSEYGVKSKPKPLTNLGNLMFGKDYKIDDSIEDATPLTINDKKKLVTSVSENKLTKFKEYVGLTRKEVHGDNAGKVTNLVDKFNKKFGTTHYVTLTPVGKSTTYTWEITERWNKYDQQEMDFNSTPETEDLDLTQEDKIKKERLIKFDVDVNKLSWINAINDGFYDSVIEENFLSLDEFNGFLEQLTSADNLEDWDRLTYKLCNIIKK